MNFETVPLGTPIITIKPAFKFSSNVPVVPNACKHEWTKSHRLHPVPAVFVREPYKKTFYIECLRCGFEKTTCINVEAPDECDHSWIENTELGPRYRAELCTKCFKSRYIKLE